MALPPTYSVGTVTVSAGDPVVAGNETMFVAAGLREGDIFERDGLSVTIESVDSNTQVTLVKPWPGSAGSGEYEVRYVGDAQRVLANARQAIQDFEGVKQPPFLPFTSKVSAISAAIPHDVKFIDVAGIRYREDVSGTALITAGGRRWAYMSGPLASDLIVRVPSDYPNIQEAIDKTSCLTANGHVITVLIEAGHRIGFGGGFEGSRRDCGHYIISSEDDVVQVSDGFDGDVVSMLEGVAPVLDCLIDMRGRGQVGYNLIKSARGSVNDGCGCINSGAFGAEIRNSNLDAENSLWHGAADTGLRIQQGSTGRAMFANCNDCGHRGIYISRSSTFNIMETTAQRCGLVNSDADQVGSGGLIARGVGPIRADRFNGSGSYNGISVSEGGLVTAPAATLLNCTNKAVRITGKGEVRIDGGSASRVGASSVIELGHGCILSAVDVDFVTSSNAPVSFFGSGSQAIVSGSQYSASANWRPYLNGADIQGNSIIDNSRADVGYVFTLSKDTASSILMPGSGNRFFTVAVSGSEITVDGVFRFRFPTPSRFDVAKSAQSAVFTATGVLTGTTGTDGRVTISPHSDGRLYVENRLASGSPVKISVAVLSCIQF